MTQPTTVLEHLIDRGTAAITRWHNTLTLKDESVAEHQHFVAEAASLICQLLQHHDIAYPNELDAVTMARLHDKAETEVGDVVGKAKRRYPELATAAREAELHAVCSMFEGMPAALRQRYRMLMRRALLSPSSKDLEAQIVVYCDRLAAYSFVHQEVLLGNKELTELGQQCYQELQELDWPWLVALREKTDVI